MYDLSDVVEASPQTPAPPVPKAPTYDLSDVLETPKVRLSGSAYDLSGILEPLPGVPPDTRGHVTQEPTTDGMWQVQPDGRRVWVPGEPAEFGPVEPFVPMKPVASHVQTRPEIAQAALAPAVAPKPGTQPPLVLGPTPATPAGSFIDPRTGEVVRRPSLGETVLDIPAQGIAQAAQGVAALAPNIRLVGGVPTLAPNADPLKIAAALNDVLEGTMKAGAVMIPGGIVAAPVATALTIGGALLLQYAGSAGAKAAGAPLEIQRLTGNLAALAAAGVGGQRVIAAVKAAPKVAGEALILSRLYGPGEVPGARGTGWAGTEGYPRAATTEVAAKPTTITLEPPVAPAEAAPVPTEPVAVEARPPARPAKPSKPASKPTVTPAPVYDLSGVVEPTAPPVAPEAAPVTPAPLPLPATPRPAKSVDMLPAATVGPAAPAEPPPVTAAPVGVTTPAPAEGVMPVAPPSPAEVAPTEPTTLPPTKPLSPHARHLEAERLRADIRNGEIRLESGVNSLGEKVSPAELETTRQLIERERARVAELEPAAETPPVVPAKQPWEMTLTEFVERTKETTGYYNLNGQQQTTWNRGGGTGLGQAVREWEDQVEAAIRAGKPVRRENLPDWALTARDAAVRSDDTLDENFKQDHRNLVADALAAGQPVPPAVLAEYPELAPKAEMPAEGVTEIPSLNVPPEVGPAPAEAPWEMPLVVPPITEAPTVAPVFAFRPRIVKQTYRGKAGFSVQWRGEDQGPPQRIFTESRAKADELKVAVLAGTRGEALDRILRAEPETLAEPETAVKQTREAVERTVNLEGTKKAADVQIRVTAALQEELDAAKQAAGFSEITFKPEGSSGRVGHVWIDGNPVALLKRHGGLEWAYPEDETLKSVTLEDIDNPSGRAPLAVQREAMARVAQAITKHQKAGRIRLEIPGDGILTIDRNPYAIGEVLRRFKMAGPTPWRGLNPTDVRQPWARKPTISEPEAAKARATAMATYQVHPAGLVALAEARRVKETQEAVAKETRRMGTHRTTHELRAAELVGPVTPAMVRATATLRAAHADIRATLIGPTLTHPARLSSRYLTWRIGQMTHTIKYANETLKAYRNAIEGLTVDHAAILDLADAIETGQSLPTWLQPWGTIRTEVFDYLKGQIADLGIEKDWHEYYLGHIWETEFKGQSVTGKALSRLIGRRPLQGPRTFLKHRTIPTMREGVEQFEKEPKTWNLVDIDLYKIEEMAKFVMGRQVREDQRRLGTWVFGSALKKRPEGTEAIADPLGEVWAPAQITVREAYDKLLMEGLESFIGSLGVTYERRATTGKTWGTTGDVTGNIKAKFGGPEFVLMHEIGHALNSRFGLYDLVATTPSVRQELSELAALRYEGEKPTETFARYVQSHDEQIANLLHAYLWAPEKAQTTAPHAYDALDGLIHERPELEPLADLQDMRSVVVGTREATQKLPGPILLGRYYAPPEVARIFKNYLTPGLGAHAAWSLIRVPANLMVQAKLCLSWFHAFTVAQESAAMEAARGLSEIVRGHPAAGVKRLGAALVEPVAVLRRGRAVRHEYLSTLDPLSLAATDATNLLMMGGGRIEMSREYTNRSLRRFLDHLRRANAAYVRHQHGRVGAEAIGAALRLLPAMVEAVSYPLMQVIVPAAKVGSTITQIRSDLAALPGEPTEATMLAIANKAVKLSDAVLGEVIWDNYFLPRVLMSAIHMLIMAPGWRGGSAILLARGLTDPFRRLFPSQRETYTVRVPTTGGAGKGPGEPPIPPTPGGRAQATKTIEVKEPYWSPYTSLMIATVFVGALIAELYQLAHGAGHIESAMDVAYPRTGETDSQGKPERVRLPGYTGIFYDILRQPPRSAVEYALGGQAPMPTAIGQWYQNETRFGEEIVDKADPWKVQLADYAKFLAQQWEPISISSYGRRAGTLVEKGESVLGISPAPRRVTNTAAEAQMREYLGPTHRTIEQGRRAEATRQLREALRAHDTEKVAEIRASGILATPSLARTQRLQGVLSSDLQFSRLPLEQALRIYSTYATPEERWRWRGRLIQKFQRAQIPPVDRPTLQQRFQDALQLPTRAKGTE
jgi:hypothetical protein